MTHPKILAALAFLAALAVFWKFSIGCDSKIIPMASEHIREAMRPGPPSTLDDHSFAPRSVAVVRESP